MRFLVYFLHRHNDFRCVSLFRVASSTSPHFSALFHFLVRGGCASRVFTNATTILFAMTDVARELPNVGFFLA
jgi:hypothetical protein